MKYPKINFDSKNKSKELTEEEAKSSTNKIIQDQEVNQYFNKKQASKKNLNKNFAIILGQCTSGVKSVLKVEANFEQEGEDVNCL